MKVVRRWGKEPSGPTFIRKEFAERCMAERDWELVGARDIDDWAQIVQDLDDFRRLEAKQLRSISLHGPGARRGAVMFFGNATLPALTHFHGSCKSARLEQFVPVQRRFPLRNFPRRNFSGGLPSEGKDAVRAAEGCFATFRWATKAACQLPQKGRLQANFWPYHVAAFASIQCMTCCSAAC